MPQLARPDSDVVNDGWLPRPVSAQVNQAVPNDLTFAISPHVPSARTFIVHLAPRAAPICGPNADNTAVPAHQLTVRLDGTGFVYAVATLLNTLHGTDRFIKAVTWYNLTPGFKNYLMTLTRQEAALIEDYTTLKVMITAFCEGSSCPSSSSSSCSPIAGWGGAGWYCVENTEPNDCVVVELLDDDQCDANVVICSGPYSTELIASQNCLEQIIGGDSCATSVPAPFNTWFGAALPIFNPFDPSASVYYYCVPVSPGMIYSLSFYAYVESGNILGNFFASGNTGPCNGTITLPTMVISENTPCYTITNPCCYSLVTADDTTHLCIWVTNGNAGSVKYFGIKVSPGYCNTPQESCSFQAKLIIGGGTFYGNFPFLPEGSYQDRWTIDIPAAGTYRINYTTTNASSPDWCITMWGIFHDPTEGCVDRDTTYLFGPTVLNASGCIDFTTTGPGCVCVILQPSCTIGTHPSYTLEVDTGTC